MLDKYNNTYLSNYFNIIFSTKKYYKMIIKAVRKHAIKMTGKKVYVLIMKKFSRPISNEI